MKAKRELTENQKLFYCMLTMQTSFLRHFWKADITLPPSTRQKTFWNDESDRVLLCTGRKTGKCVTGDTVIFDAVTGDRRLVKDMVSYHGSVPALDKDWKIRSNDDFEVFQNGVVPVYRVFTKSGLHIRVSANHPFLTGAGWVECEDLQAGDMIAAVRRSPMPEHNLSALSDPEVIVLAYLIGDGGISQKTIHFTNADKKVVDDFEQSAIQIDPGLSLKHLGRYDYSLKANRPLKLKRIGDAIPGKFLFGKHAVPTTVNPVGILLERVGLSGKNSHTKFVPDPIFRLDKDGTALFLSRLFSTDGWATEDEIGYSSVSARLIDDVRELLSRFGIFARRYEKKTYLGGISYALSIADSRDIRAFAEQVGIFSKERAVTTAYLKALEASPSKHDRIPLQLVRNTIERYGISPYAASINAGLRLKGKYQPSREKVSRIAETNEIEELRSIVESDIYWDEIESVTYVGEEETYDLTVWGPHNFAANGIITHNTVDNEGQVIRFGINHRVMGGGIEEAMLTTPGENQISPIWDRVINRIDNNPLFRLLCKAHPKNEGKIEFWSGVIWYFRIDGSSGTDANMIGLRCKKIIGDEQALAVRVCHNSRKQSALPDCKWRYTGVPNGVRHTIFWELDQTKLGSEWSRHKFSTFVNPLYWKPKAMAALKADYGEGSQDYVTQVMGVWGEEVFSSFPPGSIAVNESLPYSLSKLGSTDLPPDMLPLNRTILFNRLRVPRLNVYQYALGMDYGFLQDPTECVVAYRENAESVEWKTAARIELVGCDPKAQARFLNLLVEGLGHRMVESVCLDQASGGLAVAMDLLNDPYFGQWWQARLMDYNAGGSIEVDVILEETKEALEEEGVIVRSQKKKVRRKQYATQLLQFALINAKHDLPNAALKLWLAKDAEMLQELIDTREKKTETGNVVYVSRMDSGNRAIDHITDALRCLGLACQAAQVRSDVDAGDEVEYVEMDLFGFGRENVPKERDVLGVGWKQAGF